MERGLDRYTVLISDIAAVAGDNGTMSRDDFLAAIDRAALGVEFPGTYAVLVTETVSPDEIDTFVESLQPAENRGLLLLDSVLGQPAGDYQIGVHAAPEALRSGAIGVDGRAFAPADQSLDAAVETGEAALSPAVPQSTFELIPSSLDEKPIVALTIPLYEGAAVPTTALERRAALAGAVSVAFYPDVLLDQARGAGASGIDVSIFEEGGEAAIAATASTPAEDRQAPGDLTSSRTIDAAGQSWSLDFVALEGFRGPNTTAPWIVLVASLIVTMLLFALVYTLLRSRARALEAVREATVSLSAAAALFRTAFENAAIGMVLLAEDGTVLRVNRSTCSLLGRSGHDVVGSSIDDLLASEDSIIDDDMTRRLLAGEVDTAPLKRRFELPDGRSIWVAVSLSLIPGQDGSPGYLVAQVDDVTERHAVEAQLAHQATHDPLTGLPNRALFLDRLEVVLARRTRDGATPAVMFVDLDHFKWINDRWGHIAGDEVLATVGERFRRALRASDTVARYGGDEFTVLCEDVDQTEVCRVAQKLCDALTATITLADGEAVVGVSIGVVLADDLEDTADSLVREADAAMYRAKQEGRNRIHVVVGASGDGGPLDSPTDLSDVPVDR